MSSKHKKLIWFAAIVILVFAALAIRSRGGKGLKQEAGSASDQDSQIAQSQKQYEQSLQSSQRPFAVVIENHPDARPQSGLSQADVVYEALAEGGITRFLAIFQSQNVSSIGPVRSARTYFNDWAQEWGAVYAHVGGNSDALAQIKNGIAGVSDADQFFNDPYFTRIKSRPMPHNTYTSTDKLKALAEHHNFSMARDYSDYVYKNDSPAQTPGASKISIDFSQPLFAVKWIYDPKTDSYKRYLAGSAAVDAGNGKNILAKDIVVQRVRNWPVQSDTLYALGMGTREGGAADVYLDGTVIHGSWKYISGRTRYYDSNGNEIALNRGQIWIEIVPPDNFVTAQ